MPHDPRFPQRHPPFSNQFAPGSFMNAMNAMGNVAPPMGPPALPTAPDYLGQEVVDAARRKREERLSGGMGELSPGQREKLAGLGTMNNPELARTLDQEVAQIKAYHLAKEEGRGEDYYSTEGRLRLENLRDRGQQLEGRIASQQASNEYLQDALAGRTSEIDKPAPGTQHHPRYWKGDDSVAKAERDASGAATVRKIKNAEAAAKKGRDEEYEANIQRGIAKTSGEFERNQQIDSQVTPHGPRVKIPEVVWTNPETGKKEVTEASKRYDPRTMKPVPYTDNKGRPRIKMVKIAKAGAASKIALEGEEKPPAKKGTPGQEVATKLTDEEKFTADMAPQGRRGSPRGTPPVPKIPEEEIQAYMEREPEYGQKPDPTLDENVPIPGFGDAPPTRREPTEAEAAGFPDKYRPVLSRTKAGRIAQRLMGTLFNPGRAGIALARGEPLPWEDPAGYLPRQPWAGPPGKGVEGIRGSAGVSGPSGIDKSSGEEAAAGDTPQAEALQPTDSEQNIRDIGRSEVFGGSPIQAQQQIKFDDFGVPIIDESVVADLQVEQGGPDVRGTGTGGRRDVPSSADVGGALAGLPGKLEELIGGGVERLAPAARRIAARFPGMLSGENREQMLAELRAGDVTGLPGEEFDPDDPDPSQHPQLAPGATNIVTGEENLAVDMTPEEFEEHERRGQDPRMTERMREQLPLDPEAGYSPAEMAILQRSDVHGDIDAPLTGPSDEQLRLRAKEKQRLASRGAYADAIRHGRRMAKEQARNAPRFWYTRTGDPRADAAIAAQMAQQMGGVLREQVKGRTAREQMLGQQAQFDKALDHKSDAELVQLLALPNLPYSMKQAILRKIEEKKGLSADGGAGGAGGAGAGGGGARMPGVEGRRQLEAEDPVLLGQLDTMRDEYGTDIGRSGGAPGEWAEWISGVFGGDVQTNNADQLSYTMSKLAGMMKAGSINERNIAAVSSYLSSEYDPAVLAWLDRGDMPANIGGSRISWEETRAFFKDVLAGRIPDNPGRYANLGRSWWQG